MKLKGTPVGPLVTAYVKTFSLGTTWPQEKVEKRSCGTKGKSCSRKSLICSARKREPENEGSSARARKTYGRHRASREDDRLRLLRNVAKRLSGREQHVLERDLGLALGAVFAGELGRLREQDTAVATGVGERQDELLDVLQGAGRVRAHGLTAWQIDSHGQLSSRLRRREKRDGPEAVFSSATLSTYPPICERQNFRQRVCAG